MALAQFDRRLELLTAWGQTRTVSYRDFVLAPETDVTRETDICNGGVLTAVLPTALRASARSVSLKRAEKPLDGSVAKVAAMLDRAPDGRCQHTSSILGAAEPVPPRAVQAETVLVGKRIDTSPAQPRHVRCSSPEHCPISAARTLRPTSRRKSDELVSSYRQWSAPCAARQRK
jgi:xanthine dehydrogenase YagS FAD-binding subunit